MKRSFFTLTAAALVVTTALSGCGSSTGNGKSSASGNTDTKPAATATTTEPKKDDKPKEVKLAFRHTMTKDSDQKALARTQDAVKDAMASMPGLKIEMEGMDENVHRFQKLRAEMAAGNPPEIFTSFGGTDTKDFVKTGNVLELTPILNELGLKDKFINLDEFTVDGKIYGLPLAGYAEGFFYNKKIFKDAGVDVPKTWDEFLKACEAIKAKGFTPIALAGKDAWVINMLTNTLWVRTAGPDSVPGFNDGSRKWTDADVTDGFKKFEDLAKKDYFTKGALALGYDEQKNAFATGQAAMSFDGSWTSGFYTNKDTSKVADDVGFFAMPNLGGKGDNTLNASYSSGFAFSAKLTDDQKAGVKAFIKAMYSEKYQGRANQEEGWLPSMTYQLTGAKPIVGEITQAFKGQKLFPAFDAIVPAKSREALENGVQAIVGGKMSSSDALAKVQAAQEAANKEKK